MENSERGVSDTFVHIDECAYIDEDETGFTPVVTIDVDSDSELSAGVKKEMSAGEIERLKTSVEELHNRMNGPKRGSGVVKELSAAQITKKKAKAKSAKKSRNKNRRK